MRQRIWIPIAVLLLTPIAVPAEARPAAGLPRIEAVSEQRLGHLRRVDTGERFVPRGANYIRLAEFDAAGRHVTHHATFEPGLYDGGRADAFLAQQRHDGYNTVRVFIDPGDIPSADAGHPHGLGRGSSDTDPIYLPYMANVGDFVRRAAAHGIYVQFSLDAFPQNWYYYQLVGPVDHSQIDGNNMFFLHAGMHRAKAAYLGHFVRALRGQVGADGLSTVLAYATDNEAFVVGDRAPFGRSSGRVATADGGVYDMAVPAERQQAQDANFVSYALRMQAAVRAEDPSAMVTMGAFTYYAVGKSGPAGLPVRCSTNCSPAVDYRYPVRLASLTTWAQLPFVDLHIYPDRSADSLSRNLASIEWASVRGPVVLGEYGAFKDVHGNNVTTAAYAMRDLQRATCRERMAGWLFWTWDTTETADQRRLFTLVDSGGAINGQLAPIVRPDPCN